MSRCSNCQNEVEANNKFCKKCGAKNQYFVGRTSSDVIIPASKSPPSQQPNRPNYNPYPPQQPNPQSYASYKSEGTTLVLAIILGILGINGVGHLYVSKVGRGVAILIGSLILAIAGFATLFFGVGVILLIIYFIIFIWQIIDARNLCQEYNNYLLNNGRPPW